MKFLVLRQRDERSSELCQRIEEKAYREGGLSFPVRIDGYVFDEKLAYEHLTSPETKYYTHLFHEHCRCQLIPLSEENSSTLGGIDEVDEQYMMHGTARYTGMLDFEDEFESNFEDDDGFMDDGAYEMYAAFYSNL